MMLHPENLFRSGTGITVNTTTFCGHINGDDLKTQENVTQLEIPHCYLQALPTLQ